MALIDFSSWLAEFAKPGAEWYIKRLSGNDTLATGSHQAGPYVPRRILLGLLPMINRPETENPDVFFALYVDSHDDFRQARAIWYNNGLRGGTRNETRITNLGGRASALLDPDSTGALTIFAFVPSDAEVRECRVWVCRTTAEEDLAEAWIGPVEPGTPVLWSLGDGLLSAPHTEVRSDCYLSHEEIPSEWLAEFPSGKEIIEKAIGIRPDRDLNPDQRILSRRECEYQIFRSLEEAVEMPFILRGFNGIDSFISRAQSILQRRKARSGRSLELHAREIFLEEGLQEDSDFSHGAESEPGRRPDFLFPSQELYRNPNFPSERLRMLAAKTTCRDRWRQILNEAGRVKTKHLLTLQEGVSERQFEEMRNSGVQLVVPSALHSRYPKSVRPFLISLATFVTEIRHLRRR